MSWLLEGVVFFLQVLGVLLLIATVGAGLQWLWDRYLGPRP